MDSDRSLVDHLCRPKEWTNPIPFTMTSEANLFSGEMDELQELVDLMSLSDSNSFKGPYRHS
jgi:hypothetical protein